MKAIKLLFFTDIKGLIEKKDGFIRLSANKTVDLCYYSEEVFEKVV